MILTHEERIKFAAYLRNEISSNLTLVEQMKKISIPEGVMKAKRIQIMAAEIVAKQLEEFEQFTVGG